MNAIVAVDANWGIGRGNELLFTLRGDLKRFREITTGGTILLGRKTLETFPGGRPLPKRRNVVLTKSCHLLIVIAIRYSACSLLPIKRIYCVFNVSQRSFVTS